MSDYNQGQYDALIKLASLVEDGANFRDVLGYVDAELHQEMAKTASRADYSNRLGVESFLYGFMKEATEYLANPLDDMDESDALTYVLEKAAQSASGIVQEEDEVEKTASSVNSVIDELRELNIL